MGVCKEDRMQAFVRFVGVVAILAGGLTTLYLRLLPNLVKWSWDRRARRTIRMFKDQADQANNLD